jgi:hypothetical protein
MYIDITKTKAGNLELRLTPLGHLELKELREAHPDWYGEALLSELLDPQLCNGWTLVPPEQIGALTSGTIISDEYETDDNGDCRACGRVYWDSQYAVRDTLAELENGDIVTWQGVE